MEPMLACCYLVPKGREKDGAATTVVDYDSNAELADVYVRDAAKATLGLSLGHDTIGQPTTVVYDAGAHMNLTQARSILMHRINAAAAVPPFMWRKQE